MRRSMSTFRRGTAVMAVALGMLAISGSGASAAGGLPDILNGQADSQALRIRLTLPAVDSLVDALKTAADLEGVSLPQIGLQGIVIDQKVSLNHGEAIRSIDTTIQDVASGFAAVASGDLLTRSVDSRCAAAACDATDGVSETRIDLPLGIGSIVLNGAKSLTASNVDTQNLTQLAKVDLTLAPLLCKTCPLAAVGDALDTLTSTVNDTIISDEGPVQLNEKLETIEATLRGVLPKSIQEKILDRIVTNIGPVKPLPSLRDVELLDLSILGAHANVLPQSRNGVTGLLASSSAKIADVGILKAATGESWASLGAVDLSTQAFANGVKGGADAVAKSTVVGADLGGLLGIDIDGMDLADLTNPAYLYDALFPGQDVPEALKPVLAELAATTELLANIAGINVELFGTDKKIAADGTSAWATAGSLRITVAPKVPKVSALLSKIGQDGVIPRLAASDYVSTGIELMVEAPSASSAVAVGNVLGSVPPPPTTGVGTPLLAGLMLLGGAMVVRRFAIAPR